jgi:hypothetical protein
VNVDKAHLVPALPTISQHLLFAFAPLTRMAHTGKRCDRYAGGISLAIIAGSTILRFVIWIKRKIVTKPYGTVE